MKKTTMNKWMKKISAGFLVAALALSGSMIHSATVDAADERTVVYEERTSEFSDCIQNKTAPVKEGYLFGGWYKGQNENDFLTEQTVSDYTGTAYAKFVPAEVLSVKAQIDTTTKANGAGDKKDASIRILTGVDNLKYQYIGAKILLGDKHDVNAEAKSTVYDTLLMSEDENTAKVKADQLFGPAAKYFSVWNIIKISDVNDSKMIYARPYWETLDGTTVYGLAKYVHVEDGYLNYFSVPINMMSETKGAAGVMTMNYSTTYLTDDVIVEKGHVFDDDVEYNVSNGTITVVGNGKTVDDTKSGETLLANVRFKLQDGTKLFVASESDSKQWVRVDAGFLDFTITNPDFIDWDENNIDNPGVWNIKY